MQSFILSQIKLNWELYEFGNSPVEQSRSKTQRSFSSASHLIWSYLLTLSRASLQWFSSYLNGRSQSVFIEETSSHSRSVDFGDLQGSNLGLVLCTLTYVTTLQDLVAANKLSSGFSCHLKGPSQSAIVIGQGTSNPRCVEFWRSPRLNPGSSPIHCICGTSSRPSSLDIQVTSRFGQNLALHNLLFLSVTPKLNSLSDKVRDLSHS